jgi:tetratricopeptide (TPR) repeat protein
VKKLTIILLSFTITSALFGAGHYSSILLQGNESYKADNYEMAVQLYQEVLAAGYESSSTYFNLGNSYFKLGQTPDAILFYEKALKLNPSNADIKYNLSIANLQITDKLESLPSTFLQGIWTSIICLISVDSWAWATLISLLISAVMFMLYRISKTESTKKGSFYISILLLGISITAFVSGSQLKQKMEISSSAIVFTPSLTVKSSPANNSQGLFVIHEGTKVIVLETVDEWYKVSLSDGNTGWIEKETVKDI